MTKKIIVFSAFVFLSIFRDQQYTRMTKLTVILTTMRPRLPQLNFALALLVISKKRCLVSTVFGTFHEFSGLGFVFKTVLFLFNENVVPLEVRYIVFYNILAANNDPLEDFTWRFLCCYENNQL